MWLVALGGTVLFLVAGIQGYGAELEEPSFQAHLFLALASGLLVFFADGWMVVYLILTGRLLRRARPPEGAEGLARLREKVLARSRWVIPLLAIAALAAVATVALGAPVYTQVLSLTVHQILAWGAVALEALALALAWSLLGRHEILIRRTDAALSAEA